MAMRVGSDGMDSLPRTEGRLPESMALDDMDVETMLLTMNDQDMRAVSAVRASAPALAELVRRGASAISAGHRIHYFGAGTSGRLGALDAAELYPTFNLAPGTVVAHLAGGPRALTTAVEDAEDSVVIDAGDEESIGPGDLVIGLTASGSTPSVSAALQAAHRRGAATALICCNGAARCAADSDLTVVLDTGEEFIAGSTRLKAGTAEKLALNGFSTAVMVLCGRTWSNLMVSVNATNDKLRRRTVRILRGITGMEESDARRALEDSQGDLRVALVCALGGVDPRVARSLLEGHGWSVKRAVDSCPVPAGDDGAPRQ